MKSLANEAVEKKEFRRERSKSTVCGREPLLQHYHFGEEGCSNTTILAATAADAVVADVDVISKERA